MATAQTQIRRNVQRVGRKDVNFATAHPVISDLWITLTGILPYVAAIYIGITFRTVIMTCKGYDYTINGMDLLNVALCVMVVITVRLIRKLSNFKNRMPKDTLINCFVASNNSIADEIQLLEALHYRR